MVIHAQRLLCLLLLLVVAGCGTQRRIPPLDVDVSVTNQPAMTAAAPAAAVKKRVAAVTNSIKAPATNALTSPQVLRGGTNLAIPRVPPPVTYTNPLAMVETWVDLEQWCMANKLGPVQRIPMTGAVAYYFPTPRGNVSFVIGSTLASLGGMQFHFGYGPILINNRPYVHRLDIAKNLSALLETPPPWRSSRIIVIDPGHGGKDKGTRNVYDGASEKDFTLDWAFRMRAILVTNGWTVWMTRTNDSYVSLAERILFADRHKPDLFLSLHFNSSLPDKEAAGLETYCVTPTGLPSTESRGNPDNIFLAFPNNQFDDDNMHFADRLHRAVLKVNGDNDRGLRHARFLTVLREQHRPAVLIEGGFLSNPAEARRIADPNYRQQLAEAVAAALCEYAGPVQTAAGNSPPPVATHQ